MWTAKDKISLRFCAVWWRPLLSANEIIDLYRKFQWRKKCPTPTPDETLRICRKMWIAHFAHAHILRKALFRLTCPSYSFLLSNKNGIVNLVTSHPPRSLSLAKFTLGAYNTNITGPCKRKSTFEHAQNAQIQVTLLVAKYHRAFCYPFLHSAVVNDFVREQWRPWTDCADAQADLGLRCPHMSKKRIFAWHGQIYASAHCVDHTTVRHYTVQYRNASVNLYMI